MDYDTIRYDTAIRRDSFWKGITKESVGRWIASLLHEKKQLEDLWRGSQLESLGINEKRRDTLISEIDEELKLARFYMGHFKRMKEPNFNEWVFKRASEPQMPYNDGNIAAPSWIRTNGKIKAFIEVKDNVSSVRISLAVKNDNQYLHFCEKPGEISYANLRKKESVDTKVVELKAVAEQLFRKYEYPQYCDELRRKKTLDVLLHLLPDDKDY